ncbi:hypothetical protein [Hippea maritima]|uniref:Uncharacterized protein n=1 Tax=Hippea maritima (strain ATCC 700847 / DSM 10411 / MH2) TaxID=760142 RepID=F2LU42_HIPMA|nr:hypothetical protein [Hippea maritima]AEA34505.1 hypothetical protein Hipma_1549 [Hippea maritima DSM 10411]
MSGDFSVLPGRIIGGGEFITLDEIREKVQQLGRITKTAGSSFRLIPFNESGEDVLDFDDMYPTVYFNGDYSVDFYITGLKYEKVIEFIEKLSDILGVPIEYAELGNEKPNQKEELKKLEKFLEEFGGGYGRGKKQNNVSSGNR